MGNKADVWQGTLALMVLKTLEAMGPLHGYGVARRIEHIVVPANEQNLERLSSEVMRQGSN